MLFICKYSFKFCDKNMLFKVNYQHSGTLITTLMAACANGNTVLLYFSIFKQIMSKYYKLSGYTDVIEALLRLGANINIKSCNDLTSLEWAKRFTKNEVVELLESFMYNF